MLFPALVVVVVYGGGGDNAVSSIFKNICRDLFSLGEGRPIAPLVSSSSSPSVVIQR